MTRRSITAATAAVLAAAVVVGGAYWLGTQSSTNAAAVSQPDTRRGTPSHRPSGVANPPATHHTQPDEPDAATVARQWLRGRYTLKASDTAPDAWIARVADESTQSLSDELERRYGGGSGGATWVAFVNQQCRRTVTQLQARTVPEAPSTDTSRWLRVSGTAVTTCQIQPDDPPFPAEESVTVTLQLVRQDGRWLVNERVHAG